MHLGWMLYKHMTIIYTSHGPIFHSLLLLMYTCHWQPVLLMQSSLVSYFPQVGFEAFLYFYDTDVCYYASLNSIFIFKLLIVNEGTEIAWRTHSCIKKDCFLKKLFFIFESYIKTNIVRFFEASVLRFSFPPLSVTFVCFWMPYIFFAKCISNIQTYNRDIFPISMNTTLK